MKIENYEFELKKFKHLESRSDETNCFEAILYLNGKKLADCGNDGQGGPTDVDFFPECKETGREIEAFLKTQPKIKPEGYQFELQIDLEYIVDMLVVEYLVAREIQKSKNIIKNKEKKSLVFKRESGDYYFVTWKAHTVATLLLSDRGREEIKKIIAREVSKGNVLVNQNIPKELLPKNDSANEKI